MTTDTRKTLIETLKGATKEQWSKLASGAIQRFDSWQNQVTGFGTSIDKTTYSQFVGARPFSDQELSNLYHGDDLAARMVDVVPDEMLREGFSLDLEDADLSAALSEHLESLRIDSNLADGWRWGRLYGGAGLLLGADDGRPASSPLVPERAKALSYLYALDRRYLWPLTYYTDRGNPKLGRPETYMVSAVSSHDDQQGFAVVHETRLVLFGGASTGTREREQNNSWDYSVLHRAVEVLRSFNTGWKAVEIMLTDANQAVFKMQGMAEMISAEGQDAFKRRMQLVDMCRSVMRAMVVDGGGKVGNRDVPSEEFLRHSVSFDSIPQTLDKFMLRLAAAVQIPVTILMGQSPAGMNATGDSDFRWFYDRIKSEQTRKLAPIIRRIARVALQSKQFNRADAPITVKFAPLWTETPLAAAQTRSAQMTADAAGVAAGIWLPEEVALQRGAPDGYERELVLTDEARKVREAVVKGEYVTLTPDPTKAQIPDIELAPTDAAAVLKVNEARASMNLPPLEGPDGELTLSEFAAKSAPATAPGGFGGGKPPFGKPADPPAPKPPGDGAPLPLAPTGDQEAKTDADDYARDDDGRFAETSGGGGSGGGAGDGGSKGSAREPRQAARAAVHAALPEARVAQGKDAKPGITRQGTTEELGKVGPNSGALAFYRESDNEVVLSEKTVKGADTARDYIVNSASYEPGFIEKDEARGYGNVDHLYDLNVVHHEELHSMSRSTGGSYRGGGAVLEEVGTELSAMHVTQNAAPHLARETSLRERLLSRSGYENKIRSVQRVIEQHTGKKGDEALDAIREAHIRSALNGGAPFATGADHVRAFAEALDVTPATREAIATKLGRMRL